MNQLDKLVARLKNYRSRQVLAREKRPTEDEWGALYTDLWNEVKERKHENDR